MWPRQVTTVFSALAVALLILTVGRVAAQDVRYNFMPGTDFSKFYTYKWVAVPNATYPNQIVDAQIKDAINSQLSAKGLTLTDSDKADLYVAYQTSIDQQKQWNAYGMGGGWRFGGGMASATSSTIDVGTLVVDMYDPSTKQLVWTGRATKTLNPSSNQEKNQKNLNNAMAKLLKNYPPKH
ncbi:DUF4136 domain-containing protein [Alloacidobacterium sp.]|uniref:DUF4136 domain-containing protein n=1 Tax=Alloacidobacterium sp. TaxID=2951999 RepID=UPI002D5CD158|nr:DUF4136 domain-containing protein [Alloacidobacterium sp.]HYK36605.1 DUF4136 domain-containing protein [Alloacidobacterium sp.]